MGECRWVLIAIGVLRVLCIWKRLQRLSLRMIASSVGWMMVERAASMPASSARLIVLVSPLPLGHTV